MREILFRGKDEGTKEWVYGYYYESQKPSDFGGERRYYIFDDKTISKYNVIPETVGQYTGLTDKNGTKIFEGDIVKGLFSYCLSVNSIITFRDGAFGLLWYRGDIETFWAFTSIWNVEYEVIGNIHDNPELMEGEQQ